MLTVPYAVQRASVEHIRGALQGKVLVDATVPLRPPKVGRVQLPEGGSAVLALQDERVLETRRAALDTAQALASAPSYH